ncbi:hypothetical protein, partial [Gemmiger formicilis]|uniref:hypothetical protein n=1 Tax=Gemmiger formicilis TaxID=745368 RepID=UPI001958109C
GVHHSLRYAAPGSGRTAEKALSCKFYHKAFCCLCSGRLLCYTEKEPNINDKMYNFALIIQNDADHKRFCRKMRLRIKLCFLQKGERSSAGWQKYGMDVPLGTGHFFFRQNAEFFQKNLENRPKNTCNTGKRVL